MVPAYEDQVPLLSTALLLPLMPLPLIPRMPLSAIGPVKTASCGVTNESAMRLPPALVTVTGFENVVVPEVW